MKKIMLFSVVMFMTIFCFSQNRDLIGKWKLESVKNISGNTIDSTFLNTGNLSILFVDNKNYKIFLSENTCYGTYKTGNILSFSSGNCTKICCDDDMSIKFYQIILDASGYKIKDGNLLLYSKLKELKFSKQ